MSLICHKKAQEAQVACACHGFSSRNKLLALVSILAAITFAADIQIPTILDPDLELTLVAADPDIVTPVGCAVDSRGRLFVLESNTHFPKKNYPGAKSDRIKIFEDTDRDGRFEKITIFAEEIRWGMNIAFSPDGKLYLTHRNGVVRLDDTNNDGICDARTELVRLETKGDYPHNGIHGIVFGPNDILYLGMGENLGVPFTIVGSDGSKYFGNGDGGNAYRCRRDGSKLELLAVGGWNLFGLELDPAGNLFAVDNDPDARPPCRLLHIIEGGDYGFRFRHGRNGLNPFTAWNGELPGTLPMVAGTGEAPSAVMDCRRAKLPTRFANALLVTSWGDHDLEIFRPEPKGASFTARREVIVQGNADFRPVGLAPAPDGSVFITDWVKQDYEVHSRGRIWRLAAKKTAALAKHQPPPTPKLPRLDSSPAIRKALGSNDPFIRTAAVNALLKTSSMEQLEMEFQSKVPSVRLGALLAQRKILPTPDSAREDKRESILRRALTDPDERVRQTALLWIGDEKLTAFAEDLPKALKGAVSPKFFEVHSATVTALARKGSPPPPENEIRIFELEKVEQTSRLPIHPAGNTAGTPAQRSDAEWRAELAKAKGNAEAGRKIFFAAQTQCAACHRLEGRGGQVGPDLTYIAYNASERDIREKLMQSILHPSANIAPQFVTHEVETKDGQSFSGRLVSQTTDGSTSLTTGSLTLYTTDGKGVSIPKQQIAAQRQSKVSLMPENLAESMSVKDLRDLLEFLSVRR